MIIFCKVGCIVIFNGYGFGILFFEFFFVFEEIKVKREVVVKGVI